MPAIAGQEGVKKIGVCGLFVIVVLTFCVLGLFCHLHLLTSGSSVQCSQLVDTAG